MYSSNHRKIRQNVGEMPRLFGGLHLRHTMILALCLRTESAADPTTYYEVKRSGRTKLFWRAALREMDALRGELAGSVGGILAGFPSRGLMIIWHFVWN